MSTLRGFSLHEENFLVTLFLLLYLLSTFLFIHYSFLTNYFEIEPETEVEGAVWLLLNFSFGFFLANLLITLITSFLRVESYQKLRRLTDLSFRLAIICILLLVVLTAWVFYERSKEVLPGAER